MAIKSRTEAKLWINNLTASSLRKLAQHVTAERIGPGTTPAGVARVKAEAKALAERIEGWSRRQQAPTGVDKQG